MTKALLVLGFTLTNALFWLLIQRWLNGRGLTWREWLPVYMYGSTNVAFINWMFQ